MVHVFGKVIGIAATWAVCVQAAAQPLSAFFDSSVFVRGLWFDRADSVLYIGATRDGNNASTSLLRAWDGTDWVSLGSATDSMPGTIDEISMIGDNLFMLGWFSEVYGVPSSNKFVRWDGSQWHGMGAGGNVNQYCFLDTAANDLYALGWFDSLDYQYTGTVAKWNGNGWNGLSDPIPFVSENRPRCVAQYQGSLYVGGFLRNTPGGQKDIARWDGNTWQDVGPGILGPYSVVCSMAEYQDKLFVAGYFEQGSGNAGHHLMTWDGQQFEPFLPAYLFPLWTVNDLQVIDDVLYMAGEFFFAGQDTRHLIVRYDGSTLCGIAPDSLWITGDGGRAIKVVGNSAEIFFSVPWTDVLINGDTINQLARWDVNEPPDTCITLPDAIVEQMRPQQLRVWPNPATDQIHFELRSVGQADLEVILYDVFGREVLRATPAVSAVNRMELSLGDLPSGAYLGQLVGDPRSRFRVIKE